MSFPRKRESRFSSIPWTPAFAGVTALTHGLSLESTAPSATPACLEVIIHLRGAPAADKRLETVIPAEAGIQVFLNSLDPGFRRGDGVESWALP